jgi:2'-hydroxyisoflavone reductase
MRARILLLASRFVFTHVDEPGRAAQGRGYAGARIPTGPQDMKLLVLGGTRFLGRHVVQAALDEGHEPILLNRGRGNPGQLARSAAALGDRVAHYSFVSSLSAHAAFAPDTEYDESAALATGFEGYGAQKARAEEVIEAALPGCVAHVRPGLIVGPHDPTGRFAYWPLRVARGGDVLAPGRPLRQVQFIDARDLAQWLVRLARERRAGRFLAVGVSSTLAAVLDECRSVAGSDARFVWADDDALIALGVEPWTGLPLWIPESDPSHGGMLLADNRRAVAAGLRSRPLRETIADTLRWASADAAAAATGSALSEQQEARCLASLGVVSRRPPA